MIEVKVTGKCVGCPGCDLEVNKLFANIVPKETLVYCRNSNLCHHLEKYISDQLTAAGQPEES